MKRIVYALASFALLGGGCVVKATSTYEGTSGTDTVSKVYFTSDISPEGLLKAYRALGITPTGKVAVKISTGESSESHMLSPELMAPLVKEVGGTLVECNTAYKGNRLLTEDHLREVAKRGYDKIAPVDILDSEGSIKIPVRDTTHLPYDLVGSHLANYDYMINLAHFKGHQMGGFGGVLKNASIGVASSDGKALIHTAGEFDSASKAFRNNKGQDAFLESMAAAAQAVHDYMKGNVIYINVMNNLSVDCDCNGHPEAPRMKDIGILVSTDPVAVDQAGLDMVFNHASADGDDSEPLKARIRKMHGTHTVDYAAKLGLGSQKYELINIDTTK